MPSESSAESPETEEHKVRSRGRLHGRRRGHKLRPGQQRLIDETLPVHRLTLDKLIAHGPHAAFAVPPREIWLEVGFGGGEHLVWQAAQNPDVGLIGCEVFETGLATCVRQIEEQGVQNARIMVEDARLAIDALADASLARAFVLFPDPWRKTRHHKRRFVGRENLDALARVLVDGAELRLATDHVGYLRAMLAVATDHEAFEWLARRPEDWRDRPADWPRTRYEAKAIAAGRRPAFLRFRRRPRATTQVRLQSGAI